MLSHKHVLKDCHGLEKSDILESPCDTLFCDEIGGMLNHFGIFAEVFAGVELTHFAVRVVAGDRLAVEKHLAVGRRVNARNSVENGGLTRAVGADERDYLALVYLH